MINRNDILAFLENTSFTGVSLLYACALSLETKKPFKIDDVFGSSAEYGRGYLVALFSLGLLDRSDNHQIITVRSMNVDLIANIKEQAFAKAKRRDDLHLESGLKWADDLLRIEQYFV